VIKLPYLYNKINIYFLNSSSEFLLIGQIEDNIWLCCVSNEIQALNICRLQEAVIFFQKLADNEIPLKMLDQPIITNKK